MWQWLLCKRWIFKHQGNASFKRMENYQEQIKLPSRHLTEKNEGPFSINGAWYMCNATEETHTKITDKINEK